MRRYPLPDRDFILGIDPGLNGGMVALKLDGSEILPPMVMPRIEKELDTTQIVRWLGEISPIVRHTWLESVHARPGQGVSSMFKFGKVLGTLEGILVALEMPFTKVTPQTWMRPLHAGISREMQPKNRSRIAAGNLFPNIDLRLSARARNPHDGLVDALLLAEYGRRKLSAT